MNFSGGEGEDTMKKMKVERIIRENVLMNKKKMSVTNTLFLSFTLTLTSLIG
jgi:hypothetical protein